MRRTTCALLISLVLLGNPAGASDEFCATSETQAAEAKLMSRQKLASELGRNTAQLVSELEEIEGSSKRVAWGSSVLFGVAGSTLAIAGSAKIVAVAGAKSAGSAVARGIEMGAKKFFTWRTGGNTTIGYIWEYTSNSTVAVLLNDKWAARPLKPILKKLDGIGTQDPNARSDSALSFFLDQEHQKIRELEKEAAPKLHDGRLLSLGWDDVHHIQVLLASAKAKLRLYNLEQDETERLAWDLRAKCKGAPYGEALRLATEAKQTLEDIQNGKRSASMPHVTDSKHKQLEWRAAPSSGNASTSRGAR